MKIPRLRHWSDGRVENVNAKYSAPLIPLVVCNACGKRSWLENCETLPSEYESIGRYVLGGALASIERTTICAANAEDFFDEFEDAEAELVRLDPAVPHSSDKSTAKQWEAPCGVILSNCHMQWTELLNWSRIGRSANCDAGRTCERRYMAAQEWVMLDNERERRYWYSPLSGERSSVYEPRTNVDKARRKLMLAALAEQKLSEPAEDGRLGAAEWLRQGEWFAPAKEILDAPFQSDKVHRVAERLRWLVNLELAIVIPMQVFF